MSPPERRSVGAAAVDLPALHERVRHAAESAGVGSVETLEALAVGGASLTYRGVVKSEEQRLPFVLKLAPPGVEPTRNRDVLRQARLMKLLTEVTRINVPRVLCEDAGTSLDVPPFFMMSFERGECAEPILGPQPLPSPSDVRGRAVHACEMLADLHAFDPRIEPLRSELPVTLAEEVDRWAAAFGTVDDDLRIGALDVEAALRASWPDALDPVAQHGDYRLGNMLCSGDRVTAVIDWELWAIGDPRCDLAWLRQHTLASGNPYAVREAPGMPAPDELAAIYEAASGRELTSLSWFDALARFKQAAAGALLVKHARRREGAEARSDTARGIARQLADALRLLS